MGISTSKLVFELARIGGEAEYLVFIDGKRILDAYFISRAPVRGFERIVRGKNPLFVVEAVMRICGICHSAHGIAAVEALEDALGVSPPANGRLLREILGLLNRVQSHLIHLILITPDIIRKDFLDDILIEEIKLLNSVNDVIARIGGSPTHPPYIVIGGFGKTPSQKILSDQLRNISNILDTYRKIMEVLVDEDKQTEKVEILKSKTINIKPLASHLFYGDKYNINLQKIDVVHYNRYRGNDLPDQVSKVTSLIALYNNKAVEVGPRARLTIYREYRDNSLWGLQYARMLEIELSLLRIMELLEQIDPSEPSRSGSIVFKRGRGIGVYEAPRGTLIHTVELDGDGRVSNYRIIVPTMFNIPYMESSARNLPASIADTIPRVYDPCIPCATHMVKVR